MPTQASYCTAVGTLDDPDMSLVFGTFPTVLQTNDGDTSCLQANDNDVVERYTLTDLPAGAVNVTAMTAIWAGKKANIFNVTAKAGVYISAAYIWGTLQTFTTGNYEAHSDALAGGPWGRVAFNAAEGAIYKDAGADTTWNFTQLYINTTYTLCVGASIFLLCELLPPLVSFGTLCSREWTQIRPLMRQRFSDPDWEKVVRAARAYQYPAYCFKD